MSWQLTIRVIESWNMILKIWKSSLILRSMSHGPRASDVTTMTYNRKSRRHRIPLPSPMRCVTRCKPRSVYHYLRCVYLIICLELRRVAVTGCDCECDCETKISIAIDCIRLLLFILLQHLTAFSNYDNDKSIISTNNKFIRTNLQPLLRCSE